MKILPFKIPKPNKDALIYQEDNEYIFYDKLHQHTEIQISFILKGNGTLMVGDTISSYKENDLIVIGSNVPHVFKSETCDKKSFMLSLFFTKNSFGSSFFELPEMENLSYFFKKAENGFKLKKTNNNIIQLFKKLKNQNKLEKFICLFEILNEITSSKIISLSTQTYKKQFSELEGERLSKIIHYTLHNYKKAITITKIAEKANMTKTAFCKYFKQRTNKTYISFLNEIRIEHTCKLLLTKPELSIAEAAEISGFNNIANFNRTFKRIKNTTPIHYKNKHLELI